MDTNNHITKDKMQHLVHKLRLENEEHSNNIIMGDFNFKDHEKELKKRKIRKFNDKNWFEKLLGNIPENVQLIHCELQYGGDYCKTIVSTDSKYSIIIVDGRDRVNCILNTTSSLSQDGVLILDDSEREEYQNGVIHLKQLGYNELDFWGIAPGIFYNKCTSIFYRDNNCLGI